MIDLILVSGITGLSFGILVGGWVSYGNGAVDAYYFAREPGHPGGRKAGRIVYKRLNHMFGDIPDPDNLQKGAGHE